MKTRKFKKMSRKNPQNPLESKWYLVQAWLCIGVMLACCAVLPYGCKEDEKDIAVTGVSVEPTAVTFTAGEPQSVTATVLPREANQKVTWSSLNTNIATVDSAGLITPVAVGSTFVTATSEADKTKEASVSVTVEAAVFRVESVTIDPKSVTLEADGTVTVTAKIFPELANQQVTWRSQNNNIATVKDGIITGVWMSGTTNIIVTSAARPSIADTVVVTVKPRVFPDPPVHTLLDYKGEVIRATAMGLGLREGLEDDTWAPVGRAIANNISAWEETRSKGYNGMRIACFDPWYRTRGWESYCMSTDDLLSYLDKCVANAKQTEMTVIINYHNVGEYVIPHDVCDHTYSYEDKKCRHTKGFGTMQEFWELVAPRYANEVNVVYELNNEQAWSGSAYLEPEFMAQMKTVYDQVRADAPERTIIMFSFNNLTFDMVRIASAYTWIDWDKTVVGWHFYGGNRNEGLSNLKALLADKRFRSICTEWSTPGESYVQEFFGYRINSRPLEELHVSWADWRGFHSDFGKFTNMDDYIKPDALANGYWWGN